MPNVRISDKGQITLPVGFRRKLGLEPNTRVEITLREDEIVIRPVRSLGELYGVFHGAVAGRKPVGWDEERRLMEQSVGREGEGG